MDSRRRHFVTAGLVAVLLGVTGCASGMPAREKAAPAVIAGIVLVAPMCPVERLEDPCPPAPGRGVSVEIRRLGEVVAMGSTDERGRFRLSSPTGTVEVLAGSPRSIPRQVTQRVEAHAGETTWVRLLLDSGIR